MKGKILIAAVAASMLGAPAQSRTVDVPDNLRPPANQELMLELLARGVQVYECASASETEPRFEWKFRRPEAQLVDRAGRPMGSHYGGPTWEAPDGSAVVAEVRARADAADPKVAIPHLLLNVKSASGKGLFTPVRSIQRVDTDGGVAPSEPCTVRELTRLARVPYTATYRFYVERP